MLNKNQYKYLSILLLLSFSLQSVSAYTYVVGDDLGFLEESDSAHMVLADDSTLFYPQAPLADWDKNMESCEEASASLFWRNSLQLPKITPEAFDAEIDVINTEEEASGIEKNKTITKKTGEQKTYLRDLSLEEISEQILEKYFHMESDNVFILNNPDMGDIEKLLDNNFIVLTPVNTMEVHNPYVTRASYHIVLLAGYTESSFVSLDVATKHGFKLSYDKEVFLQSIRNNGNKVLFINSNLSNFSQMKKDALLKNIDTKVTAFKNELTSRLQSLSSSEQKIVLQKANKVLLTKIWGARTDEEKMELKRFHLVVSAELRKKSSEKLADGNIGSGNISSLVR